MEKKIPITKPYLDECEKEAILKPLESGWLVQGPYVAEFERLFAEFVGSRFAVATSNCTTALHLGLIALGIGQGDRVVVPAFTYVASANAVEYTGAEVVFCDVDLQTFNIDVQLLRKILEEDFYNRNRRIKAIMPVNLFGLCADLPQIMQLANQFNLKVIEDSACGLGAYIGQTHSGIFGHVGCFSFHPRKSITTGEGGMLVTNDAKIAELVQSLRDHGASKSDLQRHKEKGGSLLPEFNVRGYNYRMTDMQGALGMCQMKKLNFILAQKRKLASLYMEKLQEVSVILPPNIPDGYLHGFQAFVGLYVGEFNREDIFNGSLTKEKIDQLNQSRNQMMERLERMGVATRQGTHAVHTLGYYSKRYGLNPEDYLQAYAADRLSIALPLYPEMTEEDVNYVIKAIKKCVE